MNREIDEALKQLRANHGRLTRQQFKTLKGQILAGDPAGAIKGLQRLLQQKNNTKDKGATE